MSVTWPITGRLTVEYIVEARGLHREATLGYPVWTVLGTHRTRAEAVAASSRYVGDPRFLIRVRQYLSQERR